MPNSVGALDLPRTTDLASGYEATGTKILIEFIALIIRNHIYIWLEKKMKETDKRPNYMTVLVALKEL